MNQEHPQPSPVDYESGNPDEWAETPTKNELVEAGYDGEHEARNEVNFAEFKPETFDHKDNKEWKGPGKYDNSKVSAAVRKAGAAERVARATLRTVDEKLIEAQALDLMALPDKALVATLKRLDAVSPDALSRESKYKRAMACCKFAADFLGDASTQDGVERMGSILMSIDDPTLKALLKVAAELRAAHVAAEEEEEEESDDKTSSTQQQAQAPVSQQAPTAGESEEESEEDEHTAGGDAGCLSPQDMAMLDNMLGQEMAAPPVAPAPTGELTELFEAPAAAPVPTAMPAMASDGPDISFGDDDEEPRTASGGDDDQLASLFNDNPEVVAQREIAAAEAEQRAREGGYGPVASARTASTGAKKLGNVSGGKPRSVDDELGNLWEGPG